MGEQDEPKRDELERLVDVERRERARLDDAFAVDAAEDVVVDARFAQLKAEHEAAHRRLAAAKGLLTKARKDGAAEKIAAARTRVDAAYAECDRVGRSAISEMADLISGRNRTFREDVIQQLDWFDEDDVWANMGH